MNPIFWIGIILILVIAWFCMSFMFKGIGRFFIRLYDDAKNEIFEEKNDECDNA